jgi:hypothetical protein
MNQSPTPAHYPGAPRPVPMPAAAAATAYGPAAYGPAAGDPPSPGPAPAAAKALHPPRKGKATRPTVARKRRPSGPSRAYVAIWAGLAGLSMGYLAVLTVQPDVLTAMGVPIIAADPETNQGQRLTAKLASDLQTVQQSLADLQGEVTALRSSAPLVIKAEARASAVWPLDQGPELRLADPRSVDPKLQGRMTPLDGTRVAGMVITQASPPPEPAAPSGPLGLELVTGPSVDALRLNWVLLSDRHGAALKSLEARFIGGGPNSAFQLLAGPVASAEAGAQLCEQFRAKGTPCRVGQFQGQGF